MSTSPGARPRSKAPGGALLQEAYVHLTGGQHSTFTLAKAMRVSPATAFRLVKALRSSGLPIVSMKEGSRWFFVLKNEASDVFRNDPLVKGRGCIRGVQAPRGKSFNESIDDELYGNP